MKFRQTFAMLTILATIQLPYTAYAAEEDRELALIAAEQAKSEEDERLNEINPALTDTITTKPAQETDKEIKERKKKLKQTRKEKEKLNERKLKETTSKSKRDKPRREESIVIEPVTSQPKPQPVSKPVTSQPKPQPISEPVTSQPKSQPISESVTSQPKPQPVIEPVTSQPKSQPVSAPATSQVEPQTVVKNATSQSVVDPELPQSPLLATDLVNPPSEKVIYANFVEVARAVHFIPLYLPRKSGYEITAIYAGQGIVEMQYGRRWEPTVSLAVRTYKRSDGEELQDISGVTGVKWRVDTTTGTTIYIAKISDTEHVAAWAVGHYTFSARSENLSFASFHSLVADELVELSTHYYIDL